MKRIRLAIIIMAAAVAAAVLVFFAAKHISDKDQQEQQANEQKLVLFDFPESSVSKMDIRNDGGSYTAEYNKEDGWTINNDGEFTLEGTAISNAAFYMSNLKASEIISGGDTSKYGFDDPIILTVYAENGTHTLYVGDPSPTNEYFYVMKENDSNVYLIPYQAGSNLRLTKNSLKSEYPYSFFTYEVEHFALWKGEEKDENILFSMNKDKDDKWSMDRPFRDDSVYASEVDQYITSFSKDRISGFVQEKCAEADYPVYGFDKPSYVFEVTASGETTKVIFGKSDDQGYMYALYPKSGQVVAFAPNSVTALGYSTINMMDPSVFSPDKADIDTVDITGGGRTVTLDMSAKEFQADGSVVIDDKSSVSDEETDKKVRYILFFGSFNNLKANTVEKNAEPEGEPELTINYSMKDGSKVTVEYIKKGENYMAVKNGEYVGLIVSGEDVENVLELLEDFE